ncbi:MAG: M20/M25/M40 family metallo-hydrolase [Bacteroidales bacterium]|nr:M20/M25/M40 family metallo-hydrolase [Bacteroidales bacterium]
MKKYFLFLFSLISFFQGISQEQSEKVVKLIFDEALGSSVAYENLRYLCKETKGRIAGTPQAAAAVEFTRQVLEEMKLDRVFLQEVMVPHWERGNVEYGNISSVLFGSREVPVSALGRSVGTGKEGIFGRVVEVYDFEELEKVGSEKIKGKIVFFNRPLDPTLIQTFSAYGRAANQRTSGPAMAAKYGAIGVLVRSLTHATDNIPHTGVTRYEEGVEKIPAVSISTQGANLLSQWLKKDPDLTFHMITNCRNLPDVMSYNVVGELWGTEYPDEIITIGGHLDAWDTGEGAHDDGAGCIQSIEVLRIFRALGIKPKRTIRAVMFMDEEMGQTGGKKYAELAKINNEKHYTALESDRGAFTPQGFGFGTQGERLEKMIALKKYFLPYGITEFKKGGGGVDIGPLRQFGIPLISYIPDSQRYFYYHHSPKDTFEQVNPRELQMGSAAIAALIYLIDKYDL